MVYSFKAQLEHHKQLRFHCFQVFLKTILQYTEFVLFCMYRGVTKLLLHCGLKIPRGNYHNLKTMEMLFGILLLMTDKAAFTGESSIVSKQLQMLWNRYLKIWLLREHFPLIFIIYTNMSYPSYPRSLEVSETSLSRHPLTCIKNPRYNLLKLKRNWYTLNKITSKYNRYCLFFEFLSAKKNRVSFERYWNYRNSGNLATQTKHFCL